MADNDAARAKLVAEIEAVRADGDVERADLMSSLLETIDGLNRVEGEIEQGVREGWISADSDLATYGRSPI
ncbi:hypothetical protein [Variovorax sp. GT1P44]|uniref:hypothetical protein n=1 Tax=Variovorax sp. GT1P44 TaxID=3443742 RepID=UPI003F48A19C